MICIGSTVFDIMGLEVILGKDKIQSYYLEDNMDGLIDEISTHLSEDEAKELIELMEKNLTISYNDAFEKANAEKTLVYFTDSEQGEFSQGERRIKDLLLKLCRNMGQENLADILSDAYIFNDNPDSYNIYYNNNQLNMDIRYKFTQEEKEQYALSGWSSLLNENIYKPLSREQLLDMDYNEFSDFLNDEIEKAKAEKIEELKKEQEEQKQATITPEDIELATEDVRKDEFNDAIKDIEEAVKEETIDNIQTENKEKDYEK